MTVTSAALVSTSKLTAATVNTSLAHLGRVGVVAELTHRWRGRVFSDPCYVDMWAVQLVEL